MPHEGPPIRTSFALDERTSLPVILGVSFAVFLAIEAFAVWDYDAGPLRFGLLMAIGGLAAAASSIPGHVRLSRCDTVICRSIAVALLSMGFLLNAEVFWRSAREVLRRDEIVSDQAQTVLRSMALLRRGIDPYGRTTFVDPIAYDWAIASLEQAPRCSAAPTGFDTDALRSRIRDGTASVEEMDRYQLVSTTDPACANVKRRFESIGLKYGPVVILAYWPFVIAFGKSGILISNLLFVVGLTAVLLLWAWRRSRSHLLAAIAVAFVLFSVHMRWNLFEKGHTDAAPTCLAVVSLVLWLTGKRTWAAVLLALSIGAKTTPGILFLPVLLERPRHLLATLGTLAAVYCPFLAWDAKGLVNNVAFAVTRPPDSTSIAYYLETGAWWSLLGLAVLACLFLLLRARRRAWSVASVLQYLVGAHLAVLGAGGQFHNNYIVWLLPVAGMFLADLWQRASEAPGSRTEWAGIAR